MKQLAAPCPGPDVDKSQACLSLFSQNSVVGVHLTLMFKTSVWSGGAREGRRGQTAAEQHGPSHLALISIATYLCLTATPPPWKPHPIPQGSGANTENTVPCTQTFGLLLHKWPQTGPQ